MSKDYIVVATDLEPDDITFLRAFVKELNNKYVRVSDEFPGIHIIVGEGNIPSSKAAKVREILDAAVNDKILADQFKDRFEVLGGSSSKEENDFVHVFYNKHF